jgi:hypothetical protein
VLPEDLLRHVQGAVSEDPVLEEVDGRRDGLEQAARFGLERQHEGAAGPLRDRA